MTTEPDLTRAANALCGWLLENVSDEANEELATLHPQVWQEMAEIAIRAGRGEADPRPFTTSPELLA